MPPNHILDGIIANQIVVVNGYSRGQKYSVKEPDILDWLISKPDGNNGYAYSCACAGTEKVKGYMKQLSKKEFFDLY